MKIYVTTSGEYSDYHIEAIYSRKEDALRHSELINWGYAAEHVEEYEVDVYAPLRRAVSAEKTLKIAQDQRAKQAAQEAGL